MIAFDTNVLVYAHRRDSPFHEVSAEVIRRASTSQARWSLPWPCIHEFIAVVTRRGYLAEPSTLTQATTQVNRWLASPSLTVLHESPNHWATLERLLSAADASGVSIHDAKIAAICLDHGVSEFVTNDRDFEKIGALRVSNPLSE